MTKEIEHFQLHDVKVTDSYLNNSLEVTIKYLKSFEIDRLICDFRKVKGLMVTVNPYGGWENTQIKGHTLGHYLSGMAQLYDTTGDAEVLNKLKQLIEELEKCQSDNGYLGAVPEQLFDNIEQKKPAWVPWYTMHKIIAGLIDVYRITREQKAYEIVVKLGEWVYKRTSRWSEEVQKRVLAVEYGGMNDCLYELYKITSNKMFLDAAHKFDEISLFESICSDSNTVVGMHANTTIPKILGALNRYRVLGESEGFYLKTAKCFWDVITKYHTYVTGGNAEDEHLGLPGILDQERTHLTCETCGSYNMLKLSRMLFEITGDKKYLDYYESTFINSIVASQNPKTGMTTYFQPMATGYFKVFSTPYNSFWCCTGSGMESYTKFGDSIYFHNKESIYVAQYISSSVFWEEKGVWVHQTSDILNNKKMSLKIQTEHSESNFAINIRIPYWIDDNILLKVNGEKCHYTVSGGFIVLRKSWHHGDTIELLFPIKVSYSVLADNKRAVAFNYGPVTLCAGLGTEKMEMSVTGVDIQIPTRKIPIKEYIVIKNGSVEQWLSCLSDNLVKVDDAIAFRLKNTDEDENLIFIPFYQQYKERYGIYWYLTDNEDEYLANHAKSENEIPGGVVIDSLAIGNDQYELQHNIKGKETESGYKNHHRIRYAQNNGFFSYELKIDADAKNYLVMDFNYSAIMDVYDVMVNKQKILLEDCIQNQQDDVTRLIYHIPNTLLTGKTHVVLELKARNNHAMIGLIDTLKVIKTTV